MRHFRTEKTDQAEDEIRQAFRLIANARAELTIWELEEYIKGSISDLGGRGFVTSIGQAILNAATIDVRQHQSQIDEAEGR